MASSQKFRGKYRIASARHPTWDYGSSAAYFITMCTKTRAPCFGMIDNDCTDNITHASPTYSSYIFVDHTRMHTTPLGDAVRRCWMNIPSHFPYVRLDAFVVMPDHLHGIIAIDMNTVPIVGAVNTVDAVGIVGAVETQDVASLPTNTPKSTRAIPPFTNTPPFTHVQPIHTPQHPTHASHPPHRVWTPNHFGPQSCTLGSVMRGFKIGVTKFTNENDIDFSWQSRFHDRIIRDENAMKAVRLYGSSRNRVGSNLKFSATAREEV